MTNQNPIEPLPSLELVRQWSISGEGDAFVIENWTHIATKAARWGADQELEAVCEWLELHHPRVYTTGLKRCRRPKPKSQAEQALEALNEAVYMADDMPPEGISTDQAATIRAALERLRELEEGND